MSPQTADRVRGAEATFGAFAPPSPAPTIAVLGASGVLGRQLVTRLADAGWSVRVLTAAPESLPRSLRAADVRPLVVRHRASLSAALVDVSALVCAAGGAPPPLAAMGLATARVTTRACDTQGARELAEVARRAGVARVLVASMFAGLGLHQTASVRAHADIERAFASAGLPLSVVRSTTLFGDLAALVPHVAAGRVRLAGDGAAHTNPVHEADVADVCVQALREPAGIRAVGGTDVLRQRDLANLLAEAAGVPPTRGVSVSSVRARASLLRLVSPYAAAQLEYAAQASRYDVLAPRIGTRSLEDTLRRGVASPVTERSLDHLLVSA